MLFVIMGRNGKSRDSNIESALQLFPKVFFKIDLFCLSNNESRLNVWVALCYGYSNQWVIYFIYFLSCRTGSLRHVS